MSEKKRFVEPEIVKYQAPLDKITLNNFNCYGGHDEKPERRSKPHGKKKGH